ncbi:MAG: Fic family protein [Chloroflexota bacterium]
MRTYQETHPWITFQVDLRKASHKLWMLLGEAQSKCDHVAGVPLLPNVAEYLHQVFLAKGVLATTAIEGNTLTEEEVFRRLEGKLELPPSKQYLGQEIDNVVEVCNLIANQIFTDESIELGVDDIKEYNRLVLKNLPLSEDVVPGEFREHSVLIGRYRGAPADDCEYLLQKLCEWLNSDFDVPGADKVAFGILKAIVAHIYIAWIHPFGDGNGRTARLIEFKILLSVGVPTTAAHLLSNHYNLTRSEYYRHLDQAHKSGGDILPFIEYALQGFIDGLKEQITTIKQQQLQVHWINYIHDRFRDEDSISNIRRRRLVIDLSEKEKPVPTSKIRHISPRIAEAYAGKTDKTVIRDINHLITMGLVERTRKGVRAKPEIMFAFLPRTHSSD